MRGEALSHTGPSKNLLSSGRPPQGLPRSLSRSSECPWPTGSKEEVAKSPAVPGVFTSGLSMFK